MYIHGVKYQPCSVGTLAPIFDQNVVAVMSLMEPDIRKNYLSYNMTKNIRTILMLMATNVIQSMNECIGKDAEGIQGSTLFFHITRPNLAPHVEEWPWPQPCNIYNCNCDNQKYITFCLTH